MFVSSACARVAALPLALAAVFPLHAFAQAPVLKETTVTATRFPDDARSLPFGVSVVTAEDIERSGAVTVNEALMRVLGLPGRLDLNGGGDYAIDLRGFGGASDLNQVVMLDGLRLNEADIGGTRLAGIPIESVERIEVLRGSGAVLYGEGATGGVIVITTKAGRGKGEPNGGSVYAGVGSYGLRELRATGHVGGGGFSFDGSVQKRNSDNHRDNFRSRFDAASATAQWSGDAVRLGVRLSGDDLGTGLPGALTPAQFAANPRQASTPGDTASIRNSRLAAFGEAEAGAWLFGADVGQREKNVRSLFAAFGSFDYDIRASNASLRAQHLARFGAASNRFVVGSDLAHWTRDVLGAFPSLGTQSTHGVYVKDDLTLAGGTRLSAGARSERLRKDTAPSALRDRLRAWELGANQPFGAQFSAYARVGRSFRLATVDEFSFTFLGLPLRPQTSADVEVGGRWASSATTVEARVFRHRISNEIGFDVAAPGPFGPFGFPGANVNFDPTRREGIELNASHRVARDLKLAANAAMRRATFRSGPYADRDVPFVARQVAGVRAEWSPMPSHLLTGGIQRVGNSWVDLANTCRVPGYTTVDARYAYDWRNVQLSLTGSNLMDRRFFTQAVLFTGTACGTALNIYPEPGRALTAAVRVKF